MVNFDDEKDRRADCTCEDEYARDKRAIWFCKHAKTDEESHQPKDQDAKQDHWDRNSACVNINHRV